MTRVGILGAGGMGNVHARHYRRMPEVDLHFFDSSPEQAQAFSTRWDCSAAMSADDLIAICDVIDLCLPTDLHLPLGLRAIAAGRAVFVEKPMARTMDECRHLILAADRANVPFMPGQVVRYFPEFKRAHRLVAEGAVGDPAAARIRRGGGQPAGEGMWFRDYSRSGGVLLDLAVHDFDWLRWTLGEVASVYSRSVGIQRGSGPDYALTTLSLKSGAVAHVESTWMDPTGFRVTFEVAGSGGILEYDSRLNPTLRTLTAPEGVPKAQAEGNFSPEDDPYYQELSAFLGAVESGSPMPVTGEDGAMAVSIALAALESARTGKAVPPEPL